MLRFLQDGFGTSNNYHEWLGQHDPCYDINTWPNLLEFFKASNAWLSVWKAWASILNTRESDWKARSHVLKQIIGRVYKNSWRSDLKKAPYIHWNLTWLVILFLIYILPITVEAIPWDTVPSAYQLATLVI